MEDTLLAAVEAGKALMLLHSLTPLLDAPDAIPRARARLECLVTRAVEHKDADAVRHIEFVHEKLMALPRIVDIETLIRHALGRPQLRLNDLPRVLRTGGARAPERCAGALLGFIQTIPDSSHLRGTLTLYNKVVPLYAHLVRNTPWEPILRELGVVPTQAETLGGELLRHYGSPAETAQTSSTLERLLTLRDHKPAQTQLDLGLSSTAANTPTGAPESAPTPVPYLTLVQLSPTAVRLHPAVAAALEQMRGYEEFRVARVPTVAQIIKQHCQPVPVHAGDDPESLMREKLKALVAALEVRPAALKMALGQERAIQATLGSSVQGEAPAVPAVYGPAETPAGTQLASEALAAAPATTAPTQPLATEPAGAGQPTNGFPARLRQLIEANRIPGTAAPLR